MSSPPKRPAPPAPDPNWELELHGPPAGARRNGPESKDELLAHALLRSEPEPLAPSDETAEMERVTVPPPAGMADHVARMMAEAALLEDLENEGDRPTPLFEIEELPIPKVGKLGPRPLEPTPRAPLPATRPAARDPQAGALPRRATPPPFAVVQPVKPAPMRAPTPAPFAPVRPAERATGGMAGAFARAPTPAPPRAPAGAREPLPAPPQAPVALRAPSAPPRAAAPPRAPTPAPMAVRAREPVVRTAPEPPREERRISSLDLEDLPAVFGLDALSLDDPTSDRGSGRAGGAGAPDERGAGARDDGAAGGAARQGSGGAGDPVSDPAISPSLGAPPASDPAISPPFRSMEPLVLEDELGWDDPLLDDLASEYGQSVRTEDVPTTEIAIMQTTEVAALRGAVALEPAAAEEEGAEDAPPPETTAAIEARLAAGDFSRALMLVEAALETHPDAPALLRAAATCRDELYRRYLERLGAADHVPRLAVQRGALTGLALDHRAGFLLSCVDGGSTVEEIIDVSAMPRLEAVRVLYELVQEGVIEMTSRR